MGPPDFTKPPQGLNISCTRVFDHPNEDGWVNPNPERFLEYSQEKKPGTSEIAILPKISVPTASSENVNLTMFSRTLTPRQL